MYTIDERINHYFPDSNGNTLQRAIPKDFVLVYPEREIRRDFDPEITRDTIQAIIDFISEVTALDLKKSAPFDPNIVIGYRRDKDLEQGEVNPSWVPNNTVKLPWSYLWEPDQPVEACTHELAHPFFHISKVGDWGDGFCDFLRIFIIRFLNLGLKWEINGKQYDWIKYMRKNVERQGACWEYHVKALRLLKEFQSESLDMENKGHLAGFVRPLLNKTSQELESEIP